MDIAIHWGLLRHLRTRIAFRPAIVVAAIFLDVVVLGYPTTREVLARMVDYYLARTADGSTLIRVVHASVLAGMDPARAWQVFRNALGADLDDTQGGTTSEGIQLGAMAGTIDIITRSFARL